MCHESDWVRMHSELRSAILAAGVVEQFSDEQRDESDTLAHALLDVLEASRELSDRISRILEAGVTEEELHGVGEELRHVMYHVNDSRYFAYLADR